MSSGGRSKSKSAVLKVEASKMCPSRSTRSRRRTLRIFPSRPRNSPGAALPRVPTGIGDPAVPHGTIHLRVVQLKSLPHEFSQRAGMPLTLPSQSLICFAPVPGGASGVKLSSSKGSTPLGGPARCTPRWPSFSHSRFGPRRPASAPAGRATTDSRPQPRGRRAPPPPVAPSPSPDPTRGRGRLETC